MDIQTNKGKKSRDLGFPLNIENCKKPIRLGAHHKESRTQTKRNSPMAMGNSEKDSGLKSVSRTPPPVFFPSLLPIG